MFFVISGSILGVAVGHATEEAAADAAVESLAKSIGGRGAAPPALCVVEVKRILELAPPAVRERPDV